MAAGEDWRALPAVSADRVVEYCEFLSSDALRGREAITPGGEKARAWLEAWLRKHGFEPAGAEPGSYQQAFEGGVNLLALKRPKNGSSGHPAVLISVHYDGRGTECRQHPQAASEICNSASDNAAGVAAALTALEIIGDRIEAPIALALWDHEERGILGSRHFAEFPTMPLEDLRLIINLDIIGLNLFKGLERVHFALGAETGGAALQKDLQSVLESEPLEALQLSYAFGHNRSDITRFVTAGYTTPFVFFSDGDGAVYHSTADEMQRLNIEKTASVANYVARLALLAANRDEAYERRPPTVVRDAVIPTFEDLLALRVLVEKLLANANANRLDEDRKQDLAARLAKMKELIAKGRENFTQLDAVYLGTVMFVVVQTAQSLPFIP